MGCQDAFGMELNGIGLVFGPFGSHGHVLVGPSDAGGLEVVHSDRPRVVQSDL